MKKDMRVLGRRAASARFSKIAFERMARIVVTARMTHGPIAVNAAAFVGFRTGSVAGLKPPGTAMNPPPARDA